MGFNVIYSLALVILSPWLVYRSIFQGRYRRGLRQKLWGLRPSEISAAIQPNQKRIWIHAVS
ncbi:MAG: 3-deoxy-D-manno-octulosonic acid transferase, partial [Planctomycetota bacterium]